MLPSAELRRRWTAQSSLAMAAEPEAVGHKFPLPELPLPANMGKDYRYDPVISLMTNLMMEHGKKAAAQRNMAYILSLLRTSSPPTYSPNRPLLPGAPPASHLPLNPVAYLTLAVDSVAPLLRIRSQRGAAGGGVALQIPVPLGLRQRRRQAAVWIIEAASKKKTRGSGKFTFAQRVAEELMSVIEGRSAVWDRRGAVHKLGTTARSNLTWGARGGRR
ncbi:ribosomal protein S7 [Polychaeton citri CBS 116435]|uniref:Small ribosomal subunit protein uS7m n=1 Tax=Polychaeton citri CBS 116435 TaxID=1314669 RepID=A0A9P4Q3Z9_9PEZI|nr:ribosomal protein S7 [Polychaeton citri CBS 116435]